MYFGDPRPTAVDSVEDEAPLESVTESAKAMENQKKQAMWNETIQRVDAITDLSDHPIDADIKETVAAFMVNEFPVTESCEGHVEERNGKNVGMSPHVEIGIEGPEQRYVGGAAIKERLAREYGITPEEFYYHDDALIAFRRYVENHATPETPEFVEIQAQNIALRSKVSRILEEFYQNRQPDVDARLTTRLSEAVRRFYVTSSHEYPDELSEDDLEEARQQLEKEQGEMVAFTQFLKKRFFGSDEALGEEQESHERGEELNFEVLKTPEISVREEQEAQLLSFILKAKNPEWGNDDTQLSVDVKNYFSENPLDSEVSGFLDEIRALQEGGVDEEVLYTLAFTYGHPERNEGAFEVITKHKSYIENPQGLQQKLFHVLEVFGQSFSSSPLAEKLSVEIERDKKARGEILGETKARIEKLIAFFKPDPKTTGVRKISLMPTDPLDRIDTGSAFVFGEELVLKTHIENPDNLEHEFSHSMINPIVEKLSQQLTDEQKEKISQLASEKLKQDYGEGYFSLLCEEFIRTYNDVFKKGEGLQTYEDFTRKISGISAEQFQKELAQSKNFKARCRELGITSIEDLKNKSEEYFERFEENKLRDLIFEIYQEYSSRPNKEAENFEQFVLAKFPTRTRL